MTGRIEKTVFISYRRTNFPWALAIYQDLTHHGYDVFFDYLSIDSGNFEKVLIENIKARAHFLVILTPTALERCNEPGDWLRREIETAIDERRNIVPLMIETFGFGDSLVKDSLTGKIAILNSYNGLKVYSEYFFEAMAKLRERYLNVALSDIELPILDLEAKKITETQKIAASKAPQVEKEELAAQEDLEIKYLIETKTYIAQNDLEAYLQEEGVYRKAIELNPADASAYYRLGTFLYGQKRYQEAEGAFRKAIELNPAYANAYDYLGNSLRNVKRYQEAEAAYRKAIELNPREAFSYHNFGILLRNLKRYEEAVDAYRKAIELNPGEASSYHGLGISFYVLKRYDEAEAIFRQAIQLNGIANRDTVAHSWLVRLLRMKNRLAEAVSLLERLIEIAPEEFSPYLALASINKQLGQPVLSKHLTKARQLISPNNYYNLACLESVSDNSDLAFENLQRAAESDGFDVVWAWEDPDLQWIRADPRFSIIVGPKPTRSKLKALGDT